MKADPPDVPQSNSAPAFNEDVKTHEFEKTLQLLGRIRRSWKSLPATLAACICVPLGFFYLFDMLAYPWARNLTSQTPQGRWLGQITLDANRRFLVYLDMAHRADLSGNQKNYVSKLRGTIAICEPGAPPVKTDIYGNPSWTGASVALGSNVDFGGGRISPGQNTPDQRVPESIQCKATKDVLQCLFDFEHPISAKSQAFRERYKHVYPPEYTAKISVRFTRPTSGAAFADQCAAPPVR